jgi:hypothetical protein
VGRDGSACWLHPDDGPDALWQAVTRFDTFLPELRSAG